MTTAFLRHARLAARNLKIEALPLAVTVHPLNDLTLDQVEALARAAYPIVLGQLTGAQAQAPVSKVPFDHPAGAVGEHPGESPAEDA